VLFGSEMASVADGASKEYEVLSADITTSYPIRFAVRSLGWIPITEDQLTQENSSRAVNQCIVSLSSGLRDINDVVGKWGDVSVMQSFTFRLILSSIFLPIWNVK